MENPINQVTMKEEIIQLLKLQEVDLALERIRKRKEEIPDEIKRLEDTLVSKEAEYEDYLSTLKKKKMELDNMNLELDTAEEKLRTYKNQLLSLKTNEEYRAMLQQIQREEERISSLEDNILDLMEEIELLETKKPEEEKKLEEKRREIKETISALEKELKILTNELSKKEVEREEKCKLVPDKLLQQYEKLRRVRGTSVVVPVINGACGGCHSELPIHLVMELKKSGYIARCENCGRLLVYEKEE